MRYIIIGFLLSWSVQTTAQVGLRLPALKPPSFMEVRTPLKAPTTPPPLSSLPAWSSAQLPLFCRIEHQWGKKLGTTVKFRLGSVPYVEQLEGKPGY